MSSLNRPTAPNAGTAAPTEDEYLSAYRPAEPVRQVDPFRESALHRLIAHESHLRAEREHGGLLARIARWFRSASRPALAGAALSLALLLTGLPLGSLQPTAEMVMRSDPAAAMSDTPESGSADALPAQDGVTQEPIEVVRDTPWLVVAGAIGLALSLLAAERARRRWRA